MIYKILKKILALSAKKRLNKYISTIGKNCKIDAHLKIQVNNGGEITVGENVSIGRYSWVAAMALGDNKHCKLSFGDGCQIGDFNHIYATSNITFEEDVLTANFVYISDNQHEYKDVNTPVLKQPIKQLSPVKIGKGCWIGEHVSILGASIGKNAVIGANSVVTHDIPDFCVAVGVPAVIIKRFDITTNQWKTTDKNGNILS